jgi:hypothetical protein
MIARQMRSSSEPVVVGGLRGSGTRVAAHLLRELGVYLGEDLNEALDNQSFAFLLGGRPEWCRQREDQVQLALALFAGSMHGEVEVSAAERALLRDAAAEWEGRLGGSAGAAAAPGSEWVRRRLRAITEAPPMPADVPAWGWKNPSSHALLERLAEAFPGMRYVHVVRDGAELTGKAKTRREVELWGPRLGVSPGPGAGLNGDAVLRFWRLANDRAARLGERLLGERFLTLRYEAFCERPRQAVDEVGAFLGLRPPPDLAPAFAAYVAEGREPRS